MSEETTTPQVQSTRPETNLPYDPNWPLNFGKYVNTKISMLPTEYLQEMSETSTSYRKSWFEQALKNRYLEFVSEAIKISNANIIEGKPPTTEQLFVIFKQNHPQVTEERFLDYLVNIIRYVLNGKLNVR